MVKPNQLPEASHFFIINLITHFKTKEVIMKSTISMYFKAIIPVALLFVCCKKEPAISTTSPTGSISQAAKKNCLPTVTVFSTGLNNPRGLIFGRNGYLYVAEGGTGGTNSTIGSCEQVPFPVGPYKGSPTGGRISVVNRAGVRTTITDKLPSSQNNEIVGGDIVGVASIGFVDNAMYALITGAGCSHGVPSMPNGIVKVHPNGSFTMIADLSAWLKTHPVKNPEEDDFEPDGDLYSMIVVRGSFYVIEANHGDMIKVTTRGEITRVVDISATQGHIVPTSIAFHGNFFVGNLNTFPIVDGGSKIFKITPSGELSVWATGFTTILGLTFDEEGRLYVLENTTGNPFPTPGTGKIIRVSRSGVKKTIASGLNLPTGITFGPDENLYVSNVGFGPFLLEADKY
jgi:hypothetical protein